MQDGSQSKLVRDKEEESKIKEREKEKERLRSAEMEETTQREKEIKQKSEKEAQRMREIEKEKEKEKVVLMDVQHEVENNVVVVHKARKKVSNPSSSVNSSRSVSPVPLYPGPQIPSQAVCLSLQPTQKVNSENSRSNRELLLLQRKQGGADRKQSSADNIVEMRNGRSDGLRNEEVQGGTMDSHSNTIHHPLSQCNNRLKTSQNSAYKLNTKETNKQRDDNYPTDEEGGSDVDVLADSLVPIKDLQLHLALFGTMIDGLNTEVENTDLEGSESFGLDCMYLRNKKIETNKIPNVPKEREIEKAKEIEKEKEKEKEKEVVKIVVDKYDIEIKNDHRQPHSRLKQMLLENDDRDTFDLLQDTLSVTPDARDKEKDKEKEKEKIEDLQRLLKPSTSAFSMGNMAVAERDLGSEYLKRDSRRNSYQSNLAQPVRKDRGPVISGGVGLLKNLEIESNMSNRSSRRASTGSDGGVWSEVPADRGAGVGDRGGGGGGGRPLGTAHLKQSLPPSIHDLLRVSPPDESDMGREREERGREERGKDREERGRDREESGREERGHAEEKQEEERARKLLIDKEKERDKMRSIERDRDRELSRERADVVDYGLVARKKEKEQKEQERLLLREAEREKSKEWEREKVKQARERLKKDAEEEERHQRLIQERIPQNPEPHAHHVGRNERGEGGHGDNQVVTGLASGIATGGGGGERDVRRGAGREKEEVPPRERERVEAVTVHRKKGPNKPDERGARRERDPKEEDEESLLVAELLALERRQKTTLRIDDTQKRFESGIQPPSSKDSDKIRKNQGRESQLPRGKSLVRSESTPRPTRSEGVKEKKEKAAFGPGARDVRKPDSRSATAEAAVMTKSRSVAAVTAGSRGKEKEEERERERDREMEREKEREREQGTVKRELAGVKPVAQPDLIHLKAWTPAQDEVENDEEFHSPVSRNSSANGTKGKMKKIMPDIQENQPALEEGGGYLQEYRKKHADKEKEKGGTGGGGKLLRRRHSDMHQQGQGDIGREGEREEYGGQSPNVMHVSSGTQSLGHKLDRRVASKSRVTEEDSLSLPPILPASVALEGPGRLPMDKKRNRSGGTASAPSRLRHDAASSLRATPGFEPEAPVLPNPIRVSHDYGSPNGHSPILQNSSRVGKKIPVR
jgi:hypothetical protein